MSGYCYSEAYRSRMQSGQSLVEYLVILVFATLIITLPLENGLSPLAMLGDAINDYYTKFTYAISLPTSPIFLP